MKNLHEPGQLYSVAAGESKAKQRGSRSTETALESDTKVKETGKRRERSAPQLPG